MILAVIRFPESRSSIAIWYGASAANCSGGEYTTVSVYTTPSDKGLSLTYSDFSIVMTDVAPDPPRF